MTNDLDKKHVKIFVHTKAEDGYPPEEWEGLWAVPLGGGQFRIDNIPFYAKNLSCDDIVEAIKDGDDYIFKRLVYPSQNSTIRVIIYDLTDEKEIRNTLISLGCSIEGTGTDGLIAVHVPKANIDNVLDFIEGAAAGEELDFEEGALR